LDKEYIIEDSMIVAGQSESTQIVSYNPNNYNDAMYAALCAAMIRVSAISNGHLTLKCMGEVPTIQLPITVTYQSAPIGTDLVIDSVPTVGSQNPISSDGVYDALRGGRYY
jgi:hypothetical protein